MKSKDIVIATALIMLASSVLTGCGGSNGPAVPSESPEAKVEQIVKKAKAVQKEVAMVLSHQVEGDTVTVNIALSNPAQKPVTSAQTWLSYDPNKLEGVQIDAASSDFDLVAPYDNTFNNEQGLVMIGRGSSARLFGKTLQVAEVKFKRLTDETAFVDAYDYHDDLNGHSSVNTVIDGFPYNILIEPDTPALIIAN